MSFIFNKNLLRDIEDAKEKGIEADWGKAKDALNDMVRKYWKKSYPDPDYFNMEVKKNGSISVHVVNTLRNTGYVKITADNRGRVIAYDRTTYSIWDKVKWFFFNYKKKEEHYISKSKGIPKKIHQALRRLR